MTFDYKANEKLIDEADKRVARGLLEIVHCLLESEHWPLPRGRRAEIVKEHPQVHPRQMEQCIEAARQLAKCQ